MCNSRQLSLGMISINYHLHFYHPIHQVCVLRLIQVVRSVEKIEKILHSQNSKESSSLEISRWETDTLTNPLASPDRTCFWMRQVIYQGSAISVFIFGWPGVMSRINQGQSMDNFSELKKGPGYNCACLSYPNCWHKALKNLWKQYLRSLQGCGTKLLCLTSCLSVYVQSLVSRSDPREDCYRIQPAAVPRCTEQRHAPTGQSQTCKC